MIFGRGCGWVFEPASECGFGSVACNESDGFGFDQFDGMDERNLFGFHHPIGPITYILGQSAATERRVAPPWELQNA